jgi:hypothetical protein
LCTFNVGAKKLNCIATFSSEIFSIYFYSCLLDYILHNNDQAASQGPFC